ncbi:hypothetical protein C2845_PM11G26910 [Panicum miliaceum]|uniref:Uncharacterized protein n=1 Tax=Panicum miliaceum TaxID=4540 RepID=A0A3L6RRF7_PANMI|nr:hypothetical protein C2845_PM11G26910 [Panicum miliaceum]
MASRGGCAGLGAGRTGSLRAPVARAPSIRRRVAPRSSSSPPLSRTSRCRGQLAAAPPVRVRLGASRGAALRHPTRHWSPTAGPATGGHGEGAEEEDTEHERDTTAGAGWGRGRVATAAAYAGHGVAAACAGCSRGIRRRGGGKGAEEEDAKREQDAAACAGWGRGRGADGARVHAGLARRTCTTAVPRSRTTARPRPRHCRPRRRPAGHLEEEEREIGEGEMKDQI